nr:hypothetical protein Iba_chr11bCG1480 [Ipomoea batatas]
MTRIAALSLLASLTVFGWRAFAFLGLCGPAEEVQSRHDVAYERPRFCFLLQAHCRDCESLVQSLGWIVPFKQWISQQVKLVFVFEQWLCPQNQVMFLVRVVKKAQQQNLYEELLVALKAVSVEFFDSNILNDIKIQTINASLLLLNNKRPTARPCSKRLRNSTGEVLRSFVRLESSVAGSWPEKAIVCLSELGVGGLQNVNRLLQPLHLLLPRSQSLLKICHLCK